ncbi:hypothetical protein DEI91_14755 [Curtobacterium sp. MCBD17_032]|nr:hypothetical protein DEI91_14755 [Curtobacterium sp. MCBD17_032]
MAGQRGSGIEFVQVTVFSEYQSFDELKQLRHALEGRTSTPRVAEVLPAVRASAAHERLEAGGRGAVRAHSVS